MNRAKYLMVILVGTLVYVFLSVTVGQNSIRCYNYMEEQKRLVSKRASDIQIINNELYQEYSALKNDKDVIAAYARKLDYVADDEKLVKITGLKPAQTTLYDTGSVLRHEVAGYLQEKYCKMAGLFISFLTLIVLFMQDISSGKITFGKQKKTAVTGIPVYDIPQI